MSDAAEVGVYAIDLRVERAEAAALGSVLSGVERERARRFVHERDRLRFIAAHAGLRQVLGHLLDQPPAQVHMQAEPHHKPTLIDSGGVHFNLSHAGDVALVASTTHAPLGIDVERVRSMADMALVADSVFCDAELAAWRGVPDVQREQAFFRGWTRKEALIKATGEGFRADLKTLCVVLAPDAGPAVLACPPSQEAPWQLAHLEPQAGYVGAVAMRCETPFKVVWQSGLLSA